MTSSVLDEPWMDVLGKSASLVRWFCPCEDVCAKRASVVCLPFVGPW